MALSVIRKVTDKLHRSPFLAVMIDETTDVTIHEQVSQVVYIIENYYEVNEEFIGLYAVHALMLLPLSLLYGCSTMSGFRNSVAK